MEDKEQRRGENLGKHGEPRLGTSEHFLQQKRRASNHFKSGGNSSQVDFIMTRRADLKEVKETAR